MSSEENRKTALKMMADMEAFRLDDAILTDDVSWWVPGRGAISKRMFQEMAAGFQPMLAGKFTLTVHGVTADGDRVAIEAESLAPLANGKTYNNTYHFLFLFRDGKICQVKEYNDSLHAAQIFGPAIAA
jgi:ketosteroid isomerase-like protein